MTICPRCEAERALELLRQMYAWKPAPDVNPHAHAAGVAEGALESLLKYQHQPCGRHAS